MYKRTEKPQESKNQATVNFFSKNKNNGAQSFMFIDNRPKTVSQLVTYKDNEYSVPSGNIPAFRERANNDLASITSIGKPRDVARDNRMLNVVAKSDWNVKDEWQLKDIIDPSGKDYQASIENELKYIRPEVEVINSAAIFAGGVTFLNESNRFEQKSKVAVNDRMDEVANGAGKIKKIVQWQKIDGIIANANVVKGKAKSISNFFDKEGLIREELKGSFEKKVSEIKNDSGIIVNTASSIEPELKMSGDEQYLRGSVGNKADEAGGSHLIVGKKLDTFKLEKNQDKSSGILKASVWSGGVNDAFIEGGIDGEKEFRLISDVPQQIEHVLKIGDHAHFIKLAEEWGKEEKLKPEDKRETSVDSMEPVWWAIWDTRTEGLTTLSKELVKLMKAGYVLV